MSQNSASRVGEIFTAAGVAFTTLGELAMALHSGEQSPASGRWDVDDVEQLRAAVKRFGEELNKISTNIKNKTTAQLKGGIKRKIIDETKGQQQVTSPPKKATPTTPQQQSSMTKVIKISPHQLPINNSNVSDSNVSTDNIEDSANSSSDGHDGQLSNSMVQIKSCN